MTKVEKSNMQEVWQEVSSHYLQQAVVVWCEVFEVKRVWFVSGQ